MAKPAVDTSTAIAALLQPDDDHALVQALLEQLSKDRQ